MMPVGKVVWSNKDPAKLWATIEAVQPDPGGPGSLVTVKFTANVKAAEGIKALPVQCFTELSTKTFEWEKFPANDPWTHSPTPNEPVSLEGDDEE